MGAHLPFLHTPWDFALIWLNLGLNCLLMGHFILSSTLFWPLNHTDLGMDQYLLIPFLVGWTSIYQLFWCSLGVPGFDTAIWLPQLEKTELGVKQAAQFGNRRSSESCQQPWFSTSKYTVTSYWYLYGNEYDNRKSTSYRWCSHSMPSIKISINNNRIFDGKTFAWSELDRWI